MASGWTFITVNITFSVYKQPQWLKKKIVIVILGQGSNVLLGSQYKKRILANRSFLLIVSLSLETWERGHALAFPG